MDVERFEVMGFSDGAVDQLKALGLMTANHLAALVLPSGLARLVIARDNGAAGVRAAARLRDRAEAQGVVVHDLVPHLDDFNDDLGRLGAMQLRRQVLDQLAGFPSHPAS